MAKLGTKKKPAVIRVQTEKKAMEIMRLCDENGWIVIVGIEPDKEENLRDLHRLQGIKSEIVMSNKVGRNDPCPCGSNKKYKKCCG